MWFICLMFLLMQVLVFTESNCDRKHQSVIAKDECPKLKCHDECCINCDFVKRTAIEKALKVIECCSSAEPISCDDVRYSKYRSIDGSCNNLKHPAWGKSNSCLKRLLPYDYSDGKSGPRVSCRGDDLPNARMISNVIHRRNKTTETNPTVLLMTWGQMISHDMSYNDIFRTKDGNFAMDCCSSGPKTSYKCISCKIPDDDPFYLQYNQTCLSVVRTVPCPLSKSCKSGLRNHLNGNTAYHDVSIVYGQLEKDARSLRSGINGQLKVQNNPASGPLLPPKYIEQLCVSISKTERCFKSGDRRTQQNWFLLTLQTLLMRHHNNVCLKLKEINSHWGDETLYQEARRIVIAQAQAITYGYYVEYILGADIVNADKIKSLPGAEFTEYDPHVDASVFDEFTNCAQRYGHTLIPDQVKQIDPETNEVTCTETKSIYYYPFGFYHRQFDAMALGMTKQCHEEHSNYLSDQVRNFLYRNRTANESVGNDLAAISILRGRDHGIPGYVYYLRFCHGYKARSFKDLLKYIPCEKVLLLQKVYKSVYDIDLYPGGLAEYHVKGGIIGPTLACIVRRQYYKTKYGDRFYFEHGNQMGSFTLDQILAIKGVLLSRIICECTKIKRIQENVFLQPSKENPVISCDSIPPFNYTCFKETT